jgi:hypothetical protein
MICVKKHARVSIKFNTQFFRTHDTIRFIHIYFARHFPWEAKKLNKKKIMSSVNGSILILESEFSFSFAFLMFLDDDMCVV